MWMMRKSLVSKKPASAIVNRRQIVGGGTAMTCSGYLSCGRWVMLCLAALTLSFSSGYAQQRNDVDFQASAAGQITFVMPSQNVECVYTPQGGTAIYKPVDDGPELSCDRRDPKYIRVTLTPRSLRRFDDVGDQGCCGADNPFRYGARWSKGPFVCESAETGLTCKRNDGRGFVISRERMDIF
jgi:hypothetical protein